MNKILISTFVIIITVIACSHSAEVSRKDPLESARGFIESSLKGDYDEAKKYLLQDSTNIQYFEGLEDFNSSRSDVGKRRIQKCKYYN